MADPFQPPLDFDAAGLAAEAGEALVLDLDGFEGPLHVLLALARGQKVDLLKLSISALCDQYLAFILEAKARRFAVAADYLVMAAWLTFLKSRLLLPKAEKEKPGEMAPDDLAAALAIRLAKLDQVRKAVEAMQGLPQTGRDVFVRADPDAVVIHGTSRLDVDLYALIRAYVDQRRREEKRSYNPPRRVDTWPLEAARLRLKALAPDLHNWTPLGGIAPLAAGMEGPSRASYLASTLSAGLELVKDGEIEARQLEAFAEIYLRQAQHDALEAAA